MYTKRRSFELKLYMSNKDYQKLYTELLLENKKLQLDLEAKSYIIDNMQEEITHISKLIDNLYGETAELQHNKNKSIQYMREQYNSVYSEMEENINKLK